MPKLKKLTAAEMKEAENTCFEISLVLHDFDNRLIQGYVEEIPNPLQIAATFLSLSRSAADVAQRLLTKASMDERRRETERLIAEQKAR